MIEESASAKPPITHPGTGDRLLADGSTGVLDDLSAATRLEFERRAVEVRLTAGTKVFEVGDAGDALYLVRSGLIDVTSGRSDDHRLDTLGPGDIFGEQSLLTGRPRVATAVAQTGVTLWRLDHVDFLFLLGTDPQLGARVATALSRRLTARNRIDTHSTRGQTVLLAAHAPHVAAALCLSLTSACAELLHAAPVVFASGPADLWENVRLPPGTVVRDPNELTGAAIGAAREHSLVVLLYTSEVPSVACASANYVIVLDDPGAGLVHDSGHPTRILKRHPGGPEVHALAREICGRRIGLALGSGGTRGWAHAGALRVLADEGVPIDFVSGASAGAVAGALFLGGLSPDAMVHVPTIARDVLAASVRTYRPSPRAILSSRPFVRYLRDKLGKHVRIEDLETPFVIATTDLDTREPVHLRSGPLAESIVASSAINGIFPPVLIDGRRLVDGGASDPVPVAALRELGADIVIAVNVMQIGRGSAGLYTPRFRIPLPGVLDNLFIGLDTVMSQAAVLSCKMADVIVTPQGADATWHDFLPAEKYAMAGAAAMRAALPRIRDLLGIKADTA